MLQLVNRYCRSSYLSNHKSRWKLGTVEESRVCSFGKLRYEKEEMNKRNSLDEVHEEEEDNQERKEDYENKVVQNCW